LLNLNIDLKLFSISKGDNGDGESSVRYNNSGESNHKTLFVGTGKL
jgi:hypothetical protein